MEECQKYGRIVEMKVPRPSGGSRQSAGVGKIFLKYEDAASAKKALEGLGGRKFADRTVVSTYFDEVCCAMTLGNGDITNTLLGQLRCECLVVWICCESKLRPCELRSENQVEQAVRKQFTRRMQSWGTRACKPFARSVDRPKELERRKVELYRLNRVDGYRSLSSTNGPGDPAAHPKSRCTIPEV